MDLRESATYRQFRQSVRDFLAREWSESDRAGGEGPAPHQVLIGHAERTDPTAARFREAAVDAGFLYRHVPRRYGGAEQPDDALCERIVHEEFASADAPLGLIGQGPSMLVPTLLEYGTEAQKERFIRATLHGDIVWCQGYSEPEAGSDLASLRTAAELDGDHFIVRGRKIWTSDAHRSDWMFCLVRTESDAPRHRGISYLLIDMRSPGLEVRPLRLLTGEAHFNEVFFDDVRVPVENLVGSRGEGWAVSRATLKYERGLIGGHRITRRAFDHAVELARAVDVRGRRAIEDPRIRERLARLEARLRAGELHGDRLFTKRLRGEPAGAGALGTKLYTSELGHDLARLTMDLLSDHALLAPAEALAPEAGRSAYAYQWSLGILIAGGTSNVQRNIVGERGLGLPRDRRG